MPAYDDPLAALLLPALEHRPPALRPAALAETVLPKPATLLRLICSLRHNNRSFLNIAVGNYTVFRHTGQIARLLYFPGITSLTVGVFH